MGDGYHVITIPVSVYERRLASVTFDDAYSAYITAQTLSLYNHKTTQVVYCEDDMTNLVYAFIDGDEKKWC